MSTEQKTAEPKLDKKDFKPTKTTVKLTDGTTFQEGFLTLTTSLTDGKGIKTEKTNKKQAVVKTFKLAADDRRRPEITQAVQALIKAKKDDNVAECYGYFPDTESLSVVMESVAEESLDDILKKDKQLTWAQCHKIALDIAKGLAFLHSKNIFFNHFNTWHVLLKKEPTAKLIALDINADETSRTSNVTSLTTVLSTLCEKTIKGGNEGRLASLNAFAIQMLAGQKSIKDLIAFLTESKPTAALTPLELASTAQIIKTSPSAKPVETAHVDELRSPSATAETDKEKAHEARVMKALTPTASPAATTSTSSASTSASSAATTSTPSRASVSSSASSASSTTSKPAKKFITGHTVDMSAVLKQMQENGKLQNDSPADAASTAVVTADARTARFSVDTTSAPVTTTSALQTVKIEAQKAALQQEEIPTKAIFIFDLSNLKVCSEELITRWLDTTPASFAGFNGFRDDKGNTHHLISSDDFLVAATIGTKESDPTVALASCLALLTKADKKPQDIAFLNKHTALLKQTSDQLKSDTSRKEDVTRINDFLASQEQKESEDLDSNGFKQKLKLLTKNSVILFNENKSKTEKFIKRLKAALSETNSDLICIEAEEFQVKKAPDSARVTLADVNTAVTNVYISAYVDADLEKARKKHLAKTLMASTPKQAPVPAPAVAQPTTPSAADVFPAEPKYKTYISSQPTASAKAASTKKPVKSPTDSGIQLAGSDKIQSSDTLQSSEIPTKALLILDLKRYVAEQKAQAFKKIEKPVAVKAPEEKISETEGLTIRWCGIEPQFLTLSDNDAAAKERHKHQLFKAENFSEQELLASTIDFGEVLKSAHPHYSPFINTICGLLEKPEKNPQDLERIEQLMPALLKLHEQLPSSGEIDSNDKASLKFKHVFGTFLQNRNSANTGTKEEAVDPKKIEYTRRLHRQMQGSVLLYKEKLPESFASIKKALGDSVKFIEINLTHRNIKTRADLHTAITREIDSAKQQALIDDAKKMLAEVEAGAEEQQINDIVLLAQPSTATTALSAAATSTPSTVSSNSSSSSASTASSSSTSSTGSSFVKARKATLDATEEATKAAAKALAERSKSGKTTASAGPRVSGGSISSPAAKPAGSKLPVPQQ